MKRKSAKISEFSIAMSLQQAVVVLFLKNNRPVNINILGEKIEIRRLSDIPISVANWLMDQGISLRECPNLIQRNKADFKSGSRGLKVLKNGCYIKTGNDKERILDTTRKLLKLAGLSGVIKVIRKEPEWQSP